MFDQAIYSLPLVPSADGYKVAEATESSTPTMMVNPPSFLDAFRKTREPSAVEMLDELLGTAYACATLNADLVASTPVKLYVMTRRGEKPPTLRKWGATRALTRKQLAHVKSTSVETRNADEMEEVLSHPVLDLLDRPNQDDDTLGRYELLWMLSLYLDVVGRAYLYPDDTGIAGRPGRLWMLAAQHVQELSLPGSVRPIDQFKYQDQTYQPEQIVAFRRPDPRNPYKGGVAPLRSVLEQVRIGRKLNAHTNALLDNAGRPDAIFTPKGSEDGYGIGASEAKRLEAAMRQRFAMAGRGGMLVLETPGQFYPLTWPTTDIIDVAREGLNKTQIANAYQVPTSKLDRNEANRASATTGDYAHAKDAGVPRCKLVAAGLTRLCRRWDPTGRLVFVFDSCIPADMESERENDKMLISVGAVVHNELREKYGWEEREDANVRLVPANLVAVDETGKPAPAQPNFSVLMPGSTAQAGTPDASSGEQQPSETPASPENAAEGQAVGAAGQLNGAQVTAAVAIVTQVTAGLLPRDSGIGLLVNLFSLTSQQAEAMMGSAGNPKVPTTPNPNPAEEAAREQANAAAARQPNPTPPKQDAGASDDAKSAKGSCPQCGGHGHTPVPVKSEGSEVDSQQPAGDSTLAGSGTVSGAGEQGGDDSKTGQGGGGADVVLNAGKPDEAAGDAGSEQASSDDSGGSGGVTEGGDSGKEAAHDDDEAAGAVDVEDKGKAPQQEVLPASNAPTEKITRRFKSLVAAAPLDQGTIAKLTHILHKTFDAQRAAVLADVDNKGLEEAAHKAPAPVDPAVGLPRQFILLTEWDEKLADEVRPVLEVVAKQAGKRLLQQVGASPEMFAVVDRNVPQAVQQLSMKFAQSTNATTSLRLEEARTQLRQQITEGVFQGDNRAEMRKRVQEVFEDANNNRANMIAHTETMRAIHKAEQVTAKESGAVKKKFWLLSEDACPTCDEIANTNQDGVALDKLFADFGGEYGAIDGPPAHPNCQCSLTYEVDEASLQMPEEED